MLPILGDLLPYAVPVALSPLPIIAVVMLLLAPAGARGGLGFLIGRMVALVGLTMVVALLAGALAGAPEEAERGGWLRIGFGCLLIVAAVVLWRRRPRGDEAGAPPGWMRSSDGATPARAFRLGLLLTAANLKELALVAGAGMIVGGAELPLGQVLALSAVFAALAGLGVAVPVIWALAAPQGSRERLGALRDWLVRNNSAVMAAVLLAIGAMLIGSGLESL
jgi:hypothetical protein